MTQLLDALLLLAILTAASLSGLAVAVVAARCCGTHYHPDQGEHVRRALKGQRWRGSGYTIRPVGEEESDDY